MTVEQAVAKLDSLKPNAYSVEAKLEWLEAADGFIRRELSERYDAEIPLEGLCVPDPYSALYVYYLAAQVDFFNGEFYRYNNSMAMYNSVLASYGDYVNRTGRVKSPAVIKAGIGRD